MTTSSASDLRRRTDPVALVEAGRGLAVRYGKAHGALTASGGAAIEAALTALGIGPGAEVLVPATGCYKIAAAVARVGARPVFVPVGTDLVLTPERVVVALRASVRAVIAVHEHGLPCPVTLLRDVLPPSVSLVEDVAQAWDVRSRGVLAGTIGEMTVTSFGPTKPVALGAGGAVLGNAPLLNAMVDIGDVAQRHLPRVPLLAPFPAPLLSALSDALSAADDCVASQRTFADAVRPLLHDHGFASWSVREGDKPAWQRVPLWCSNRIERDTVLAAFDEAGVPAQLPHARPLHRLPMFAAASQPAPSWDHLEEEALVLLRPDPALAPSTLSRALDSARPKLGPG